MRVLQPPKDSGNSRRRRRKKSSNPVLFTIGLYHIREDSGPFSSMKMA